MLKALAISTTLLLASAAGSFAAEIGIRTESGSSWQNATHGRAHESYKGKSKSSTRSTRVNYTGGGAGRSYSGGAGGSFEVETTRTRSKESFSGGSANRFNGGSNSSFSGTSIFAN